MSMSDIMFEYKDEVDGMVDNIDRYLADETRTYKAHSTGDFAEDLKLDLRMVRLKMNALQAVLDAQVLSIESVDTYGMPGAAERLIAAPRLGRGHDGRVDARWNRADVRWRDFRERR